MFIEIIDEINNAKLRARLADIVWLLKRDKDFALKAVDAYIQTPLNSDNCDCWERAIQLCFMLKVVNKLQEIELKLIEAIKQSSLEDNYLALKLANLLNKYSLGKNELLVITEKLEKIAFLLEANNNFDLSRPYFIRASDFYKKLGDNQQSAQMQIKVAEIWIKEAQDRQRGENPCYLVSADFYSNAIQVYRNIEKKYKSVFDIDAKIKEIKTILAETQQASLTQMGRISSEPIDISDLVKEARNCVGGKDSFSALIALASIYKISIKKTQDNYNELKNDNSLFYLIPQAHIANDGRTIAQANTDEHYIITNYTMEIALVANSIIFPALDLIQQEHRIQEIDFYLWVEQSPYIPKDRIALIAKALYAGYDNDFAIALHLLVPQIEHFVRMQLKQAGEHTTYLDKTVIETENGLSSLMENPRVNEIFGEDLAFELKALFCNPLGVNLRNELAHGLINYEQSQFSPYSIYAWWLMLRIAFKHF